MAWLRLVGEDVRIGGTWRSAEALGDLYSQRDEKLRALEYYELAISFLASRPNEPAQSKDLQRLVSLASGMKILASDDAEGRQPAEFAKSRDEVDGRVGGIYSPVLLRGTDVVAVPLPINFYFDETRVTPVGHAAMDELAEALSEQNVRSVLLVGHADPRGDRKYNLELSRRRAEGETHRDRSRTSCCRRSRPSPAFLFRVISRRSRR
jgi:outer membrane protein OmpA-like peptidoglycan-associated protein